MTKPPHIARFLLLHGRLPVINDPVPPWHFQGWQLPIIQMVHKHPAVVNRWGYYQAILEADRLIDAPIPRVNFCSPYARGGQVGLNHLWRCVDVLDRYFGGWDSLMRFIDWLAFSVGFGDEMPAIDDEARERLYRLWNLEHWLTMPGDYLGYALSERHAKGWNPNGFFPTPHEVVEAMVEMNLAGEVRDTRTLTVLDPCVGTGRMLLHLSNYSLRLYGQDIDYKCVQSTIINGALYAPWIAYPLPERIFGNASVALTEAASPPLSPAITITVKPTTSALQGALFDLGQKPKRRVRKLGKV